MLWWPQRTWSSWVAGALTAVFLIGAETLVAYPLLAYVPPETLGVVYLFGVVVVSLAWGLGLGALTAIASATAYDYFHLPPVGVIFALNVQYWLILPLYLVMALLVGVVGDLARSRAIQAEQATERARQLGEKQAALRRVATLAVRGAPASEIFNAVAHEIGAVLTTRYVQLGRFEPDKTMTVVGGWSDEANTQNLLPVGSCWEMPAGSLPEVIWRTRQPTKQDIHQGHEAVILPTDPAIASAVGCPIMVEGRVWGFIASLSSALEPHPAPAQARIADFTELLATAIADAENRTRLTETQSRSVTAVDHTLRRVEVDMHECVQRHLHTLGLQLSAAENTAGEPTQLQACLSRIDHGLVSLVAELRGMFWGIPPQIRSEEDFVTALNMLARHCSLPVELTTHIQRRLPTPVETAVYHVISETLTNATHAHAHAVHVDLDTNQTGLRLSIRDDGVGGATLNTEPELIGLRDRIEALDGRLQITSPKGQGTSLLITVPISDRSQQRDTHPTNKPHKRHRPPDSAQ